MKAQDSISLNNAQHNHIILKTELVFCFYFSRFFFFWFCFALFYLYYYFRERRKDIQQHRSHTYFPFIARYKNAFIQTFTIYMGYTAISFCISSISWCEKTVLFAYHFYCHSNIFKYISKSLQYDFSTCAFLFKGIKMNRKKHTSKIKLIKDKEWKQKKKKFPKIGATKMKKNK